MSLGLFCQYDYSVSSHCRNESVKLFKTFLGSRPGLVYRTGCQWDYFVNRTILSIGLFSCHFRNESVKCQAHLDSRPFSVYRTILSIGLFFNRTILSIGLFCNRTILSIGLFCNRTILSIRLCCH